MVKPVEGSPFIPEQLQWFIDHKSDSNYQISSPARLSQHSFRPSSSFYASLVAGGSMAAFAFTYKYQYLEKFSIITEGTYGVAMGFLKFSILFLSTAQFSPLRLVTDISGVRTAVFILGWMLTSSLGAILQCIPIAKAYDNLLDGYCIHYGTLSLIVGILNVITDFVILALPIPLVLKLNTSAEKKRVIIITFAAGSSVAIASIVRLVYSPDVDTIDGLWGRVTNTCGGGSTREITRVESNQSGRNKSPGHIIMIKATDDGYTQTSQKGSPGINITEDVDLVRLANRNGAWAGVEDEDSSLQKTG
ncbi:hypothetical protein F5B21DRAFT_503577 [Xylaria acuta]|nr:hypothetical protein F5B21DRAFT_503577 [Xylaria acuta]